MKSRRLPLNGIRVLEAGAALAVPLASRTLADFGAEIVKVESAVRPELGRVTIFADNTPGERFWEKGGFYTEANRNKLGVSLDLSTESGRDIFKDLVKISDVVLENFTPRVMANFGLTYDKLREVNPDIIAMSSTGYGHTGPWRDYRAYGFATEPTTGITHYTGYEGDAPFRSIISYSDTPAAYVGAFAILTALEHRARTGEGQWIDLSQYEVGVSFAAEGPLRWQLNGDLGSRIGNHDLQMSPHNTYRCQGNDQWIAITVRDDTQWLAFCSVIGQPSLANDPRFATVIDRKRHEQELDAIISAWTANRDGRETMTLLQTAGVPAGLVLDSREAMLDPHLNARDFYDDATHDPSIPGLGTRRYPAAPWAIRGGRPPLRTTAPTLGEHNHEILNDLLGLSDDEMQDLHDMGVTATVPVGVSKMDRGRPNSLDDLQRLGLIREYDSDFMQKLGIDDAPTGTTPESRSGTHANSTVPSGAKGEVPAET